MGRLVDIDEVVKVVDRHTKDEPEVILDDDITCILEEVPTAKGDDYNKGLEDAWGVARKIFTTFKVGDVVMGDDDLDELGVITWAAGDDVYVMWSDGSCGQERFIESLHKTGKHIDVPEFLQKIGGVE